MVSPTDSEGDQGRTHRTVAQNDSGQFDRPSARNRVDQVVSIAHTPTGYRHRGTLSDWKRQAGAARGRPSGRRLKEACAV